MLQSNEALMLQSKESLMLQSKEPLGMPIKGYYCKTNRKDLLKCQSKGILKMPIEGNLKTLITNFLFLRQGFMTNHVGEGLGKHERANVGVQQLPVLNILKLENVDWLV